MMAFTPTVLVEMGLDAPGIDHSIVLDSPLYGVLDDTGLALAEDGTTVTLVDVTSRTTQLSITRGRSGVTSTPSPGVATLTLVNVDGNLDPDNPAGTYYPGVAVGMDVRISCQGVVVFTGLVDDLSYGYDVGGFATVQVRAVDTLAKLGLALIPAGTVFSAQATGARVSSVLTALDLALTTDIDAGKETLAAETTADDINALAYLGLIERSEDGRIFAAADGTVTFRNRHAAMSTPVAVTFGDDGAAGSVPYTQIQRVAPARDLYNDLRGTLRSSGAAVVATDTASVTVHGLRSWGFGEVLNSTLAAAELVADWVVLKLRSAGPRFSSVSVPINRMDQADPDLAALLALDLADPVTVIFTPPNVAELTQSVVVESISHSASAGGLWTTTLTMSPRVDAFILDDAVYGVLDEYVLAH